MDIHVMMLPSAIKLTGGVVESTSLTAVRYAVGHLNWLDAAAVPLIVIVIIIDGGWLVPRHYLDMFD
jgi:hypothetical protein